MIPSRALFAALALLVFLGLLACRALGQALRAGESRRPDHGLGPRPCRFVLHAPCLRVTRGCPRRRGRNRRRLRMQLIRIARGIAAALAAGWLLCPASSIAGVLPEDRADLMYHYYDGGGVQIDGPSLLVRKKFAEKYAVNASYYVDMVSSASIDVITTASPYKEERTQYGLGFEYLRGKVTYAASFSNSKENDYDADTASFSISQDMFGDLTTVQLAFSRGKDDVTRRGDDVFSEKVDRHIYGIDVSQIVSKKLILGASWETTTEEGFLNNPYRQRALRRRRAARLFLRARALSAHANRQCTGIPRALFPAVPRRAAGRLSLVQRYLGHRREHIRDRLHAADRRPADVRCPLPLLHAGRGRFLLGPVPAGELPEFPGARQGTRDDGQPDAGFRRRL